MPPMQKFPKDLQKPCWQKSICTIKTTQKPDNLQKKSSTVANSNYWEAHQTILCPENLLQTCSLIQTTIMKNLFSHCSGKVILTTVLPTTATPSSASVTAASLHPTLLTAVCLHLLRTFWISTVPMTSEDTKH